MGTASRKNRNIGSPKKKKWSKLATSKEQLEKQSKKDDLAARNALFVKLRDTKVILPRGNGEKGRRNHNLAMNRRLLIITTDSEWPWALPIQANSRKYGMTIDILYFVSTDQIVEALNGYEKGFYWTIVLAPSHGMDGWKKVKRVKEKKRTKPVLLFDKNANSKVKDLRWDQSNLKPFVALAVTLGVKHLSIVCCWQGLFLDHYMKMLPEAFRESKEKFIISGFDLGVTTTARHIDTWIAQGCSMKGARTSSMKVGGFVHVCNTNFDPKKFRYCD
jgi:hypothetical protein